MESPCDEEHFSVRAVALSAISFLVLKIYVIVTYQWKALVMKNI